VLGAQRRDQVEPLAAVVDEIELSFGEV
jgi:hypothetical protein